MGALDVTLAPTSSLGITPIRGLHGSQKSISGGSSEGGGRLGLSVPAGDAFGYPEAIISFHHLFVTQPMRGSIFVLIRKLFQFL